MCDQVMRALPYALAAKRVAIDTVIEPTQKSAHQGIHEIRKHVTNRAHDPYDTLLLNVFLMLCYRHCLLLSAESWFVLPSIGHYFLFVQFGP